MSYAYKMFLVLLAKVGIRRALAVVASRFGWKMAIKVLFAHFRFRVAGAIALDAMAKSTRALAPVLGRRASAKAAATLTKAYSAALPGAVEKIATKTIRQKVAYGTKWIVGFWVTGEALELIVDFGRYVYDEITEEFGEIRESLLTHTILYIKDNHGDKFQVVKKWYQDQETEIEKALERFGEEHPDELNDALVYAAEKLGIFDDIALGLTSKKEKALEGLAEDIDAPLEDVMNAAEETERAVQNEQVVSVPLTDVVTTAYSLNGDDLQYFGKTSQIANDLKLWGVEVQKQFNAAGGVELTTAIRDLIILDKTEYIQAVEDAYGPDYARDLARRS